MPDRDDCVKLPLIGITPATWSRDSPTSFRYAGSAPSMATSVAPAEWPETKILSALPPYSAACARTQANARATSCTWPG